MRFFSEQESYEKNGEKPNLQHIGNNHETDFGATDVDEFEFADFTVAAGECDILHVTVHRVFRLCTSQQRKIVTLECWNMNSTNKE
jgi:hypothetical protein